jgi:molybdopterin converting factor small subunit
MSEKITLKILYFAKLKDILNKNSDTVSVSIENNKILGKDIFQYAITINTNLRDELRPVFDTCLISLNDEYIEREQEIQLKQGDEISILPPISAG